MDKSVDEVFARLTDFAFYNDLKKAIMAANGKDIDHGRPADRASFSTYRRRA